MMNKKWIWRGDVIVFFFFNDTATTEIYTLSLHDALPILDLDRRADRTRTKPGRTKVLSGDEPGEPRTNPGRSDSSRDRKSTRLNSSHANISYAVFCLKKKK